MPLPTDSFLPQVESYIMAGKTNQPRCDGGSNGSSPQVKATPHFFKIIHSSDVPLQKLRIPVKFISQYGQNLGNHAFLTVPNGAVWKVELEKYEGVIWMCNGWKEFAKYYSIGFGHLLVFRYEGNNNFNVFIFDTSALEIKYPVSAIQGEQNDINGTEMEVIEIDDSAEILGDIPCETYNARREETYTKDEIDKLGTRSCQETRKASNCRAKVEEDVSVEILNDSLKRDFQISKRRRANSESRMENNSNKQEFPLDTQWKGLKLPNQKKDVKTEMETEECVGGTSIGERRARQRQSQIPIKMQSATANKNSTALERAQNFRSKNPFFTVYMQPSYVSHKYNMNIPLNFVKKYLRDHHKNINLKILDGTIWSVRSFTSSRTGKRSLAWRQFASDNNLKVGDVCIFELMSKGIEPRLNVTIFRK